RCRCIGGFGYCDAPNGARGRSRQRGGISGERGGELCYRSGDLCGWRLVMSRGSSKIWDVLIVGCGPGGSTAAAMLARAGYSVLVVDRDTFPRFHIGESLLSDGGAILAGLGIQPDASICLNKRGAQFVCDATNRVALFDFSRVHPDEKRHSWHVERAAF